MKKVRMYFVGNDGEKTLFAVNMENNVDMDRLEKRAKEASERFKKEVAVSIDENHKEEFVDFKK